MPFFDLLLGRFSPDDNEAFPVIDAPPTPAFIEATIPDDPGNTNFVQTDDPSSQIFWTDFKAFNRLVKDRKVFVGGLSSPDGLGGQTAAFVQLTTPVTIWICEWTSAAFGDHPRIPDPESVGGNWVLLDDHYEAPTVSTDGGRRVTWYRASGTYVYGCVSPQEPTVLDLKFPVPMWISPDFVEQSCDGSELVSGLISDDTDQATGGDAGGGGGGFFRES